MDSQITGLAYYIKESLYRRWKADRLQVEQKWQRNLDAFKSVSRGEWKVEEAEGWRSDTFVQVTKIKILAAWSIVTDMFLQGGEVPFSLQVSPFSEPDMEGLQPDEQAAVDQAIEDMTSLIQSQLSDCQADQHLVKCIMSSAIYGEAYGKRFVQPVTKKYYKKQDFGVEYGIERPDLVRFVKVDVTKNQPAWRYVSVWDIFRDVEADDISGGVGVVERQLMSTYQLRQFAEKPLYIDSAIKAAIKAAPRRGDTTYTGDKTEDLPPRFRDIKHRSKNIEVLEFWGRAPRVLVEEFEKEQSVGKPAIGNATGLDAIKEVEDTGDEVEVSVIVAGDHIIRFARTDQEDRPFYRAMWELSLDDNNGTGVADNMESVQKVLNGMVRAFEDNKKLSANVILALKKRYLAKQDNVLKPGTDIEIAEECDDVRKAVQQVVIQDVGESLLSGIAMFERYADEASQLPKIMQGETAEKKKPDTLGEMNMLQQNAGKYLGGVIKNHDDGLIEPIITDFYDYNMEDPENEKGRGDFIVKPLGFTSFQNRVTRLEKIMSFLNLASQDEELRQIAKIKSLIREVAKALDLDPDDVVKTDEELDIEMQQRIAMEEKAKMEMQAQMAEDKAREDEIQERQMVVAQQKHEQDLEKEDKKFYQDIIKEKVKRGSSEPGKVSENKRTDSGSGEGQGNRSIKSAA